MEHNSYKKLLIVDDDHIVRLVHQAYFSHRFSITLAADGAEALNILSEEYFDAVLTDINMPIMSGFVLAREIRKLETNSRNTVIIGVTATEASDVKEEAFSVGMNDIYMKPVELAVIESQLNKFIGGM